jgi:hypothetical protein
MWTQNSQSVHYLPVQLPLPQKLQGPRSDLRHRKYSERLCSPLAGPGNHSVVQQPDLCFSFSHSPSPLKFVQNSGNEFQEQNTEVLQSQDIGSLLPGSLNLSNSTTDRKELLLRGTDRLVVKFLAWLRQNGLGFPSHRKPWPLPLKYKLWSAIKQWWFEFLSLVIPYKYNSPMVPVGNHSFSLKKNVPPWTQKDSFFF